MMSTTYGNSENRSRVREPLFQKNRIKYRNARLSELENLETNLLKLDLTRINDELSTIDFSILNNLNFFISSNSQLSDTIRLNDGVTSDLTGIQFYYDDDSLLEDLELDSINKLSGKFTRLVNKIQRLEMGR